MSHRNGNGFARDAPSCILRTYNGEIVDTFNKFAVGVQGDKITIFNIVGPARISKEEALNLAAWLVSLADPGGEKFADMLSAVQNGD
jgi:hypothetical protein